MEDIVLADAIKKYRAAQLVLDTTNPTAVSGHVWMELVKRADGAKAEMARIIRAKAKKSV